MTLAQRLRYLFALLLALVCCGCEQSARRVDEISADSKRYYLGNNVYIREFHLTDGTRCVTNSQYGGITCDWYSASAHKGGVE